MKGLIENILKSTETILLLLLIICFFSCSSRILVNTDSISISKLQEEAIQCVLEDYYRHTTKKIQKSAQLVILKKSFYFKTGLSISESLPVVRGKLQDTVSTKTIPKIKSVKSVKMTNSLVAKEQQSLDKNFWQFSPLYYTQTKDYYAIVSKNSNYEATEVSIHLIRRKKNGRFEYLLPVDGYIVFN